MIRGELDHADDGGVISRSEAIAQVLQMTVREAGDFFVEESSVPRTLCRFSAGAVPLRALTVRDRRLSLILIADSRAF
ncbi:hypothetical protein [Hydrocarboniphaga sp.]|uniref:hypothetical protein n=1 Tax=Hydrocarboniphaga sp. TaxID=2033016 RepID=UPI003D0C23C5